MKSILLVYKSKTGFTKKYVDWITETIACKTISLDLIDSIDINSYDIIIYGAGMHAGRVNGLKVFKKKVLNVVRKQIVVFVTGGAPFTEENVAQIKTNNFSTDELKGVKLFYFQSGLNYDKMGLGGKAMMKVYKKILEFKNDKSDMEEGTSKAIGDSYDHSNSEYIKPMIAYLREISSDLG